MSIADQIKDLAKQKEEIEHRIRQLQKAAAASCIIPTGYEVIGSTPEPSIAGSEEKPFVNALEVYSRGVDRLKANAAYRLLIDGSDLKDLKFLYKDGSLFSLQDTVRRKEVRFNIDFGSTDAPVIKFSAELMEMEK